MAYDPLPPHALIFKYGKLQIGVTGMGIVALVLLAAGFSAGRYLGLW